MNKLLAMITLTLGMLAGSQALAAEQPYNRVSLRAEASVEIPHDLMHVTLYTEERNTDAARLAQSITQTLNQAIEQARQADTVKVSTGNRHSSPVYDEKGKKIIAWRERAELRLESTDFAGLSMLTGQLLQGMSMGSMRFSIAGNTRQEQESRLLEQAITAFTERARLTTRTLGGKDYRLISLSLNSQGGYQPPMYNRAVMMSAPAADSAVAPAVEAGNSELKMIADGQIEVLY